MIVKEKLAGYYGALTTTLKVLILGGTKFRGWQTQNLCFLGIKFPV